MASRHAHETIEEIEKQEVTHHGQRPSRVLSVDLLRGIAVAFMILVNDPGDWGHVYHPLNHAAWNGWTLTDLVFPAFLFLMGASMVFSLAARVAKGNCTGSLAAHLFARGGRILLLGLVLAYFPEMHWHTLRYFGVLQRIALCYVLVGLVLLMTRRLRWLAAVVAAILITYWALLRFVPVPQFGVPGRDVPLWDQTANLTAWLDRATVAFTQRWLHMGALFEHNRDPEGVLSTLPAVASTLLGAMAGVWMRRVGHGRIRVQTMRVGLLAAGAASVVLGEIWSLWFPVNKNLWTSSFVLLTAGWTAVALAGCSWLVDARRGRWPGWLSAVTWPWFVFGANAIVAFAFSEAFVDVMLMLHTVDVDGYPHTFWSLIYQHLFAWRGSTDLTSLAFACAFVVFCFLPNWWLWSRRVFLKI
jgi:predicted acyltransferase